MISKTIGYHGVHYFQTHPDPGNKPLHLAGVVVAYAAVAQRRFPMTWQAGRQCAKGRSSAGRSLPYIHYTT